MIQTGPLATVQDRGRFGFRKYGIPQSGAMDLEGLQLANQLVGNDPDSAAIEYALSGMSLEVLEDSLIGLFGAALKINNERILANAASVKKDDKIELSTPKLRYAYFAIGGKLKADYQFQSYSTYIPGNFGGLEGRALKKGDLLVTGGTGKLQQVKPRPMPGNIIRFIKGPEWGCLAEPFESKEFQIDPSSNRIGIRLIGKKLKTHFSEIRSSAVVPGTIQLPPNGQPIVLMNDCQTTGGYPRIGKVLDEDLGKLGQVRVGKEIILLLA